MGASLAIALKCLFAILGCLVTGFVIYTVAIDGFSFVITPLTTIDSYIHVFLIWSLVVYKEANWITAIPWAVLLVCFRSITICGYILLQFLKLSTQESLQDPVYFVLLQCQKKTMEEVFSLNCKNSVSCFGLIYILVTYGSPFRRDAFTPWMSATLIDYFVIVIALSVWVAYKESSRLSAAFWIIPIILCGSPITSHVPILLFSFSVSHLKIPSTLFFSAATTDTSRAFPRQFHRRSKEVAVHAKAMYAIFAPPNIPATVS